MGRYSRKDMIEFANFAKSYQSPRNVVDAYNAYLAGARLTIPIRINSDIYQKIRKSNIVYINGKMVKDKYVSEELVHYPILENLKFFEILSWDEGSGILHLIDRKK